MGNDFHIIIKSETNSLSNSTCLIKILLRDKNIKDEINLTLSYSAAGNSVFHYYHKSNCIVLIESLEFYFLTASEEEKIFLDSVEIINLNSKKYYFFPCNQWISKSLEYISTGNKNKRKPKFEIFTGKNKQYYFRLKGANNEIVLQSEGYKTKASALKGMNVVRKTAPNANTIDLTTKR